MAGYIHALVPNLTEAEEILQNANAALLRKRAEAESVENFPAWALRVVYFEVLAFRKQRARDRHVFFPEEGVFEALAVEGMNHWSQNDHVLEALANCLESVRPRDRELLSKRYQAGQSIDELAARADCSLGAVRQMLYRIRNQLQHCIRQKLAAENRQ